MTARSIIESAFRELNAIPTGTSPTDAEINEALDLLNTFIRSLFSFDLGIKLRDFPIPIVESLCLSADDRSLINFKNVRFIVRNMTPTTVALSDDIDDGALIQAVDAGSSSDFTISSTSRLIDASFTLTLQPGFISKTLFYRADKGAWITVPETLNIDDEVPFPPDLDDLLITGLAIRLSSRFSVEIFSGTERAFRRALARARSRYAQNVDTPVSKQPLELLAGDGLW